jgi:NCS2 family nucleobase:cation symporter-2
MSFSGFSSFILYVTAIFSIMPKPIVGTILIFVVCFMVISGIQILVSSRIHKVALP